jgi:hypothetical protein
MPELVAHSLAQYKELALALARSPARLASLKGQLAHNKRAPPYSIRSDFAATWKQPSAKYGE